LDNLPATDLAALVAASEYLKILGGVAFSLSLVCVLSQNLSFTQSSIEENANPTQQKPSIVARQQPSPSSAYFPKMFVFTLRTQRRRL
jgi:hypothetical protein